MQFREITDRYQLEKILKSHRFGTGGNKLLSLSNQVIYPHSSLSTSSSWKMPSFPQDYRSSHDLYHKWSNDDIPFYHSNNTLDRMLSC